MHHHDGGIDVDAVLVVGVPWNKDDLTALADEAAGAGLRVVVADTVGALERLASHPALDVHPLRDVTVGHLCEAAEAIGARHVISLATLRMELAATVREKLGLPGTPSQVEATVADKLRTRQALAANGLTTVRFLGTTPTRLADDVAAADLPVIVKPRGLAGSTAVHLLRTTVDFAAAVGYYDPVVAGASGRDQLIVEEVIDGPEISAEGLVVDGRLSLFTLTDKTNTGAPHYYETGHVMPSRFTADWADRVTAYLRDVVAALGIVTSPLHAELKLNGERVELVEIHTRFGGGHLPRLVERSCGVRPFGAFLRALVGRPQLDACDGPTAWGIGYFTARVGQPVRWPSFAFPAPEAVAEIRFDRDATPQADSIEGVRIQHWRAGYAMFHSDDPAAVHANVAFMKDTYLRS